VANYDSNSDNVKAVQTAINSAGYSPALTVDGQYGPETQAGVIWFQGQHGLTQDGIIGDATMAATIAPLPGHDPLAGMKSAIAALAATKAAQAVGAPAAAIIAAATPAASPALVPNSVIHLRLNPSQAPVTTPMVTTIVPLHPGMGPVIPAVAGAALGAGAGTIFGWPLWTAVGGAGGLVVGLLAYAIFKKPANMATVPQVIPVGSVAMHGEHNPRNEYMAAYDDVLAGPLYSAVSDFGFDDGFGCDDYALEYGSGEIKG
jgi:hypothetical protein